MKFTTIQIAVSAVAVLLVAPSSVVAKSHHHFERRLEHSHGHLNHHVKRGGKCAFPSDEPDLVAVTPDSKNAGWAMSPDQECEPDSYCPYACKSGMVMNQWDPDSTYDYPASMNGGLYCNEDGEIETPFKGEPLCVKGSGAVEAVNKCGSEMSWCQTVLPGNEAMLIPTVVSSSAVIAVPDTSYWCETAAHYYINPPGTGSEGCIWGTDGEPIGNWSPYVAGANTDKSGETFVKIGWNPIWEDSGLKSKLPSFGVEVKCPDGGCVGLPCKIDPTKGSGKVRSNQAGVGAGNSAFCVVTVPKGKKAQIVAYDVGSGSGGDDSDSDSDSDSDFDEATSTESEAESTTEEPTTTAEPTTSEEPTTTEEPETTTTSSEKETSSTKTTSTADKTTKEKSSTPTPTTFSPSTKKSKSPSTTKTPKGGIFHEEEDEDSTSSVNNQTTTKPQATTAAPSAEAASTTSTGQAGRQQGSATMAGLLGVFVVAAFFS